MLITRLHPTKGLGRSDVWVAIVSGAKRRTRMDMPLESLDIFGDKNKV